MPQASPAGMIPAGSHSLASVRREGRAPGEGRRRVVGEGRGAHADGQMCGGAGPVSWSRPAGALVGYGMTVSVAAPVVGLRMSSPEKLATMG